MKKVIENICPINGVTPEQLYEQAKYLFWTLKIVLSDEERNDAIGNAVITILQKMKEGTVPKFNYNDFKGYLFRTLKNAALEQIERRNRKKRLFNTNMTRFDFDEFEFQIADDSDSIIQEKIHNERIEDKNLETLKALIEKLDEEDRKIIKDYLSGIAWKDLKIPYHAYFVNIQRKIKRLLNPKSKKEKPPKKEKVNVSQIVIPRAKLSPKKRFLNLLIDRPTPEQKIYNRKIYNLNYRILKLKNYKEKIALLKKHNFSHRQIEQMLECSKSTVTYWCNKIYRDKAKKRNKKTKEQWREMKRRIKERTIL